MKKRLVSMMTAFVLSLVLVFGTMTSAFAEESMGDVADELSATANAYMENYLAPSVEDGIGYAQVLAAALCLKSGVEADEVYATIDEALADAISNYSEGGILGSSPEYGTTAYALAATILYLEERGVDVTDYEGQDLTALLKEAYAADGTAINPYAYQLVLAVINNEADTDWGTLKDTVKEAIVAGYVDGDTGTGYDYWGVSADNNGMVIAALVEFLDEDEISDILQSSFDWVYSLNDESGAVVSWGAANPDSTALALKFAAQFGAADTAEAYYQALAQFKSANTEGLYIYGGEDSSFSTLDAIWGLLAYNASNEGIYWYTIVNVTEEETEEDTEEDVEEETVEETTATSTPTPTVTTAVASTDSPSTGDADMLYVAFGFAAVLGLGVLTMKKREENL